jgi:hypothetical protein
MDVTGQRRSLTGSAAKREPRAGGFHAIGVSCAKLAAPIIEKRGGSHLGRLKAVWPTIAGTDWGTFAWPAALARDGALKLLVAPSAALELQHRAALLIERVNLFLGRAVVTRLVLVQGLPPPASVPVVQPSRQLTADEASALEQTLGGITDPELHNALAGLGRAILGSRPVAPGVAPGSRSR